MGYCFSKKKRDRDDTILLKEKSKNPIKLPVERYYRTEKQKKIQRLALKRVLDQVKK